MISPQEQLKEFLASTRGTQKTAQTDRWTCKPIILWLGHLERLTEVQLNNC